MLDSPLYALSATQLAMATFVLTHDATGTTHGFDTEQILVQLTHAHDLATLCTAWNIVSRHHTILSTSIEWRDSQFLSQRVHGDVEIPFRLHSCASEDPAELTHLLESDRANGFQLDSPPLQRVTAIATAAGVTQLLWTIHHILIDGRSFEPVLIDIFSVYEQLVAGAVQPQLIWRGAFRDHIATLGVDGPNNEFGLTAPVRDVGRILTHSPSADSSEFGTIVEHCALVSRVRDFASQHGVSAAAVVTAAWALTLARIAASQNVLFSLSRLGREGLEGESKTMVGPFTVTVPFYVELAPALQTRDFLKLVHDLLKQFSSAQGASLLNSSNSSGATPDVLPETHFLYENSDPEADIPQAPQLASHIRSVHIYERTTFPVTLTVHRSSSFRVTLSYQGQRCSAVLAARLMKSFLHNLDALTSASYANLAQFDGIPTEDRELLVHRWTDTARDFPSEEPIFASFLRQCELLPDAVAVEHLGSKVTYAELNRRSNQVAHYLVEKGLKAGDVIAVYQRRSPLLIVAILAVAKLGGVYVAIDPKYPAHRRQFMIEDCNARLILTDNMTHRASAEAELNLEADSVQSALATQLTSTLASGPHAQERCYIMYTSGSTGKPKGAILTHRAVNNTLDWVNRTFGVQGGDKLLFVNSPSFDLSVFDIFGTLAAGATIHISASEASVDPQGLVQTLVSGGITIWNSAPSFLQLLLQYAPVKPTHTLRLILLSGDWIPIPLVTQLRELFPSATLVSLGGATEAAIWSNYYIIQSVSKDWRSVPYGHPIQNCQYHILDDDMQLVPIGTAGELFIGGECVASGYLNREDLTQFRFPPNPFGAGRLYRTGDLCRYLDDDGTIEILGRKDNQVKIRGYRVELGDVEHALLQLPNVQAAACTTTRDISNQLSIVAFVVLEPTADFDETSLHNLLHEHLPDFMLPSRIVRMSALPLASTGKVDRTALRVPTESTVSPTTAQPTPGNEQAALIDIWQRLLNRRAIAPTDDFFELGGHSLLAIHLINEINRTFAVQVHLGTLFQHRTPRQLAARIVELQASQTGAEAWTSLVPIQPMGDLPPLLCVAGAGGSPVEGRPLAVALGTAQPFYGIQLALLPHSDGAPTVSQIAESILTDLRASKLHGPCFLGGFSAGGVIAQEVARKLRQEGSHVPLLVLLDAFNPTLGRWSSLERMRHFASMLRVYGLSYSLNRLQARLQHKILPAISGRGPSELAAIQAQTTYAIDHHVPQRYSGPTLLIRTMAKPVVDVDYRTDPSNGWASTIENLKVITVPGRHDELLTTQAALVAGHIRDALRASQDVIGTLNGSQKP